MQVFVKVVALLETTRPLPWLKNKAEAAIGSRLQAEYQAALNDPAITVVGWGYKWKAAVLDEATNLVEIYPKLGVELDTTYTEDEIWVMLDAAIDGMKQAIRDELGSDAKTTILSWHTHYSTGSVDEEEA